MLSLVTDDAVTIMHAKAQQVSALLCHIVVCNQLMQFEVTFDPEATCGRIALSIYIYSIHM
jgi:hypothetical protein